jgi:hypothetical protein
MAPQRGFALSDYPSPRRRIVERGDLLKAALSLQFFCPLEITDRHKRQLRRLLAI